MPALTLIRGDGRPPEMTLGEIRDYIADRWPDLPPADPWASALRDIAGMLSEELSNRGGIA